MCTSTVFWSAVGSAVGGFGGVIIFFLLRLFIEWKRSSPSNIQSYLCGNELNQGQPSETDGDLKHHQANEFPTQLIIRP